MTAKGPSNSFSSRDETDMFREKQGAKPPVNPSARSGPGEARFEPGKILAGRYRLVDMLGRGGMGEVYRADDLKLGEPVALKFLPEELKFDAKALARFHREVRIARQIAHRNVCRVYDIGEAEGTHFLTMEYIDGEDLSMLLRRIGRLPQAKALELAGQICRGLDAAHKAGVLHRDLKPANVMIDGKGRAKITDFGLAHLREELRQSATNQFIGTPAYMAPEQLKGADFTERTDLYSLGMVLYEMFTGRKAFPDENWIRLLARGGRNEPPTNPHEYVEGLSPKIGWTLLRCLEKDPADRPRSALEVLAALPGGDPLRAVLEAGETPSPEMVAGMFEHRVVLPVWQGASLLAAFVCFVLIFQLMAGRTTLLGMVAPNVHPEVLEDRARNLLRDVGWRVLEDPKADTFSAFRFEYERIRHLAGDGTVDWQRRVDERPALISFYHRTSDSSLFDLRVHKPSPTVPEPRPGDSLVVFDSRGRLEHLRLDPRPGVSDGGRPDWRAILDWAEIAPVDLNELPAPPLNTGGLSLPVHDERRAWSALLDDRDLRIDAASFGSLPVFFKLSVNQKPLDQGLEILSEPFFVVFLFMLALAGGIAFHNVRQRRVDVWGAVVTSAIVAITFLLGEIVSRYPSSRFLEFEFLRGILSMVAYRAFAVVIFYLAMEPWVRSWAPHLIVTWTRLVRGRWNDSRVGRDILLGTTLGAGIATTFVFLRDLWGSSPLVIFHLEEKLSGLGPLLGMVSHLPWLTVTGALAVAMCFSLVQRWLKRRWLAAALIAVGVALLASDPLPAALPLILAGAGVLTAIFAWAAFALVALTPATGDPSLWWAWPEAWSMSALLLVVAVVAFRNATGLGLGLGSRTAAAP